MNLNISDYETLSTTPFPNLCRTCGIYADELYLIDDVNEDGIYLKEVIINWTNLQFEEDDQLPRNMCKSCIKSMYHLYHFLFNCDRVKNILLEVLRKSNENLDQKIVIKQEKQEIEMVTVDKLETIEDEQQLETGTAKAEKEDITVQKDCQLTNNTSNDGNKKVPRIKRSSLFRQGPPFKCITCDVIFDKYDDLKKHKLETKHRQKKSLKHSCPHCQKRIEDYSKYVEHVRTHTGEKPNKCPICGKGFNFKQSLRKHTLLHKDIKPYKCKLCYEGFSQKQYLLDHSRKHSGEKLICLFCGKHFVTYASLKYHEKTHKVSDEDPLALTCELCGKILASEPSLKSHMLLHGPKNFLCEICCKTYPTENRLRSHILSTHRKPKFTCDVCGKMFNQKLSLEEHQKSRCTQNNYNCDLCGKKYACKLSLQQHRRIHTGDTKYQCKECSRICVNRRLLDDHMRVHTGEKPYSCAFCTKSFKQKSTLNEHKKIHAAEKTYECKMCEKKFYSTGSLKKHISDKHEKKEAELVA